MMKRMLFLMMTLALLAVMTLPARAAGEEPLTLYAINVGKGDALLINAGSDTYLVDTGKVEHWGDVSRALKQLHVSHLTGVILTHTDKDHSGGLLPLATSTITVERWYAPWAYTGKEKNHPAVEAAELRGQDVTWLRPGDTLPLGTGKMTVIGPLTSYEEENDNSLVMVAEGGGGRILLTGDMELPGEERLLKAGVIPTCDVIKIPNHGDGDATGTALIRAVQPKTAIISTSSAEKSDTPSTRVMQLLRAEGVKTYVTQDAAAGILLTLDEGKTEVMMMSGYDNIPEKAKDVAIAGVDNRDDRITLRNAGKQDADVGGWYIVSERGGEIFVLPQDQVIPAGGTLVISSDSSDEEGDLRWPEKKVWHKSKDDAAVLYDVYGRQIDRFE